MIKTPFQKDPVGTGSRGGKATFLKVGSQGMAERGRSGNKRKVIKKLKGIFNSQLELHTVGEVDGKAKMAQGKKTIFHLDDIISILDNFK